MLSFNVKSDAVQKVIANTTNDVVKLLNSLDRNDNSILPLVNLTRGMQDIVEELVKSCQTIMSGQFPEIKSVIDVPEKESVSPTKKETNSEEDDDDDDDENENEEGENEKKEESVKEYVCNMLHKPMPNTLQAPSGGAKQLKALEDPENLKGLLTAFTPAKCDIRKIEVEPDNIQDFKTGTTIAGLDYVTFTIGGDWECPVQAFLYWDGTDIRGYVPVKGNRINTLINAAFGNNDEKDLVYLTKEFKQDIKAEELYAFCSILKIDFAACLDDFTTVVEINNELDDDKRIISEDEVEDEDNENDDEEDEEAEDEDEDEGNKETPEQLKEQFRTAPRGGEKELRELFNDKHDDVFRLLRYCETPAIKRICDDLGVWKIFALDDCVGDDRWGTTASGIDYVTAAVGGDEDIPVQIFLYWDGKAVRGYLPIKGNPINMRTGHTLRTDPEFWGEVADWEKAEYTEIDFNVCLKNFEEHVTVAE